MEDWLELATRTMLSCVAGFRPDRQDPHRKKDGLLLRTKRYLILKRKALEFFMATERPFIQCLA